MRRAFVLCAWLLAACGGGSSEAESPIDAGVDADTAEPACSRVDVDPMNCGACGNVCEAGSFCSLGVCTDRCDDSLVACGKGCRALSADRSACGGCGLSCASAEVCDRGACAGACTEGRVDCSGGCRDLLSDPAHCGACDRRCEKGTVCSVGRCVTTCDAGLVRCGSACVDVRSDVRSCGGCGKSCAPGQVCLEGSCSAGCPAGFTACAGACRALATDRENCGACGKTCASGFVCDAGACVASCGGGLSACGAGCHDLASDAAHCGTCDRACATGEVCVAGSCGPRCPEGFSACGGTCRDVRNDRAHCGACGAACATGESCVAGKCAVVCTGGATLCGGSCRDLSIDPNHCGACGSACAVGPSATATCSAGACGLKCADGFVDCDGNRVNGCETTSAGPCTCNLASFPASTKVCNPTASSDFGGGSGRPGDPYLVCSLAQLARISAFPTAHFALRADLTFTSPHLPIGAVTEFGGVFDGGGHKLVLPVVNGVGFFARTGACSVIRDLVIEGLQLRCPTCTGDVGGLVGHHAGLIDRVRIDGEVSAPIAERVGGVAGSVTGSIEHTTASVTVTGLTGVGGIAGALYGTVRDSASLGAVLGAEQLGGLAGRVRGVIDRSFTRGTVTASAPPRDALGGLVGLLDGGVVRDSIATAAVYRSGGSTGRFAGFVGFAELSGGVPASIQRCFAAPQTVDSLSVAGPVFLGGGKATIVASYFLDHPLVVAQSLPGLVAVGSTSVPEDQVSSYPLLDFALFRIPLSDTESWWTKPIPTLAFRCNGTTVLCP